MPTRSSAPESDPDWLVVDATLAKQVGAMALHVDCPLKWKSLQSGSRTRWATVLTGPDDSQQFKVPETVAQEHILRMPPVRDGSEAERLVQRWTTPSPLTPSRFGRLAALETEETAGDSGPEALEKDEPTPPQPRSPQPSGPAGAAMARSAARRADANSFRRACDHDGARLQTKVLIAWRVQAAEQREARSMSARMAAAAERAAAASAAADAIGKAEEAAERLRTLFADAFSPTDVEEAKEARRANRELEQKAIGIERVRRLGPVVDKWKACTRFAPPPPPHRPASSPGAERRAQFYQYLDDEGLESLHERLIAGGVNSRKLLQAMTPAEVIDEIGDVRPPAILRLLSNVCAAEGGVAAPARPPTQAKQRGGSLNELIANAKPSGKAPAKPKPPPPERPAAKSSKACIAAQMPALARRVGEMEESSIMRLAPEWGRLLMAALAEDYPEVTRMCDASASGIAAAQQLEVLLEHAIRSKLCAPEDLDLLSEYDPTAEPEAFELDACMQMRRFCVDLSGSAKKSARPLAKPPPPQPKPPADSAAWDALVDRLEGGNSKKGDLAFVAATDRLNAVAQDSEAAAALELAAGKARQGESVMGDFKLLLNAHPVVANAFFSKAINPRAGTRQAEIAGLLESISERLAHDVGKGAREVLPNGVSFVDLAKAVASGELGSFDWSSLVATSSTPPKDKAAKVAAGLTSSLTALEFCLESIMVLDGSISDTTKTLRGLQTSASARGAGLECVSAVWLPLFTKLSQDFGFFKRAGDVLPTLGASWKAVNAIDGGEPALRRFIQEHGPGALSDSGASSARVKALEQTIERLTKDNVELSSRMKATNARIDATDRRLKLYAEALAQQLEFEVPRETNQSAAPLGGRGRGGGKGEKGGGKGGAKGAGRGRGDVHAAAPTAAAGQ